MGIGQHVMCSICATVRAYKYIYFFLYCLPQNTPLHTLICTQHSQPTGSQVELVFPCLSLEIWVSGSVGEVARAWWASEENQPVTGSLKPAQITLSSLYLSPPSAAASAVVFQRKVQHIERMTSWLYKEIL